MAGAMQNFNAGATPTGVVIMGGVGADGTPTAGSIVARSAASVPMGYQPITSLAAATGLSVPAGATFAVIQAETQAVRWRDDGVNPTATVGMTIPAGGELLYDGNLATIKLIEAAASAKLNVAYYA